MDNLPEVASDGDIYNALVQTNGHFAQAGRMIGLTRAEVAARVNAVPLLRALCDDIRETLVDDAEAVMIRDVTSGDQSAARFVLERMGKERGWTTKQEVSVEPIEIIVRDIEREVADGANTPSE